jgi:hypothetical protein
MGELGTPGLLAIAPMDGVMTSLFEPVAVALMEMPTKLPPAVMVMVSLRNPIRRSGWPPTPGT